LVTLASLKYNLVCGQISGRYRPDKTEPNPQCFSPGIGRRLFVHVTPKLLVAEPSRIPDHSQRENLKNPGGILRKPLGGCLSDSSSAGIKRTCGALAPVFGTPPKSLSPLH